VSKPATKNLELYQGSTWDQIVNVTTDDAGLVPMNLTGFSARMQVRESIDAETVILDLTPANGRIAVTNPATGTIQILVSAADTAALPLGFETQTYVYDLEVFRATPAPEYVRKVMKGKLKCYPEVTRI
jgi:hypothetical protein